MELRTHHKNDRQGQDLLKLLTVFPNTVSDYLWAAITVGNTYPSLADQFEALAQKEAKQFRLLGELMLRHGFDPPLRTLLRRGGTPLCLPTQDKEPSIDTFLRAMQQRAEQTLAFARRILTVPLLEEEDVTSELLRAQEESLQQLRRMLS